MNHSTRISITVILLAVLSLFFKSNAQEVVVKDFRLDRERKTILDRQKERFRLFIQLDNTYISKAYL